MIVNECASTNDLARALAEQGAPHGRWVSARRQSAGRGRLGRRWEEGEGNLYLSIVARPARGTALSWVPLAVAVGVANAWDGIRIKWPNDLWIGGEKAGGILCEGTGDYVIIGIGLNCLSHPEGLDQPTTSLSRARGKPVHADEVRLPVIASVLKALECCGTERLAERYEALSVLSRGTAIEWGGEHGTVEGLGPAGELLAMRADGERARIFADDVKVRALQSRSGKT